MCNYPWTVVLIIMLTHPAFIVSNIDVDVSYKRKPVNSNVDLKEVPLPTIPVPFIRIKSTSFEDVQRYAENALQQHAAMSAVSENLDTESDWREEIAKILATINKLEAARADLSTEERVTRASLAKGVTTSGSYIPVPYPVAVNPVFS